jgi:hypothetical protein
MSSSHDEDTVLPVHRQFFEVRHLETILILSHLGKSHRPDDRGRLDWPAVFGTVIMGAMSEFTSKPKHNLD